MHTLFNHKHPLHYSQTELYVVRYHRVVNKKSKNTFNAKDTLKNSGEWADGINCPAIITQQDVCVLVWGQVVWVRILSLISPKHDGFQALSLYHYYSLRLAEFLLPLAGECASPALALCLQHTAEIPSHLVNLQPAPLHLLKCQNQIRSIWRKWLSTVSAGWVN